MAGAILCCKLNCGGWRVIVLWMHLYGVKSFFPEVCQCRYCYAEESRTCCRIQARRHMFCSLIKHCRHKMLHTFPSVVRCFFLVWSHGKLLCKSFFFGKDAILKLPYMFFQCKREGLGTPGCVLPKKPYQLLTTWKGTKELSWSSSLYQSQETAMLGMVQRFFFRGGLNKLKYG